MLPEAWRAQMSATLGLVPPDDRDGCLQDVHWFSGGIGGAFQSYTIGNVLSAQLYDAACKTHPQIPSEIEVGRFDMLHEWLKSHLYRYGRKYRPNELMERLVGGLSVRPYLAYLRFPRVDGAVQSDCLSGGLPLRSAWRRTPSHGDPKWL
ncbi:MAG: hypothetical protein ACLQJR_19155 [Stellaceae bacterium]